MPTLTNLRKELKAKANPKKAKLLQRYFKTGKGEYGEGDVFLGVMVPETRKIARKYKDLKLKEIEKLLKSKFHEERLAALLILVQQFQQRHSVMINHNTMMYHSVSEHKPFSAKTLEAQGAMTCHSTPLKHLKEGVMTCHSNRSSEKIQEKIFNFYLRNTKYINNWDLVDLSAPKIVGEYLLDKNKQILYRLAKSKNIWERRIAVLSTFAFISRGKFNEALKIAEMLLNDERDLIHKAVGWMLREIGKPRNVHGDALRGKKDQKTLERFLKKHASKMPRVMLRYAIERLPAGKRYLKIKSQH